MTKSIQFLRNVLGRPSLGQGSMIAGISVLVDPDWIDLAGMPKLKYFTPRGGICTTGSLTSEPWGTQTVRLPDFVRIGKYAIGEGINLGNCIMQVFGCQTGMI